MSSKRKSLSVVIVSYNVKYKLLRCLRKISSKFHSWQVIIIDNASSDGTPKRLEKQFGKAIILKTNKHNKGFSKAVNEGIKISDSNYILLLNPDTIPNIESIQYLLDFMKRDNNLGILGGGLTRPHSEGIHGTFVNKPRFLTAIFEFTNFKKLFKNNRFYKNFYFKDKEITQPLDVWGVSGAFMLVKRRVIEKIGLFDNNFFMYLEDIDFCLRAKRFGFRVVFNPKANIIHESGSSSPNRYRINIKAWRKSRKYFFRKHLGVVKGNILKFLFVADENIVDLKHRLCKGGGVHESCDCKRKVS